MARTPEDCAAPSLNNKKSASMKRRHKNISFEGLKEKNPRRAWVRRIAGSFFSCRFYMAACCPAMRPKTIASSSPQVRLNEIPLKPPVTSPAA